MQADWGGRQSLFDLGLREPAGQGQSQGCFLCPLLAGGLQPRVGGTGLGSPGTTHCVASVTCSRGERGAVEAGCPSGLFCREQRPFSEVCGSAGPPRPRQSSGTWLENSLYIN